MISRLFAVTACLLALAACKTTRFVCYSSDKLNCGNCREIVAYYNSSSNTEFITGNRRTYSCNDCRNNTEVPSTRVPLTYSNVGDDDRLIVDAYCETVGPWAVIVSTIISILVYVCCCGCLICGISYCVRRGRGRQSPGVVHGQASAIPVSPIYPPQFMPFGNNQPLYTSEFVQAPQIQMQPHFQPPPPMTYIVSNDLQASPQIQPRDSQPMPAVTEKRSF